MRSDRRLEILIFFAAFFAFAYFNQGGGWNQNSRFAEVRAIAEQGTLAIDSFLVYKRTRTAELARLPVENGDVVRNGKTLRLSWVNSDGELVPVNGIEPTGAVEGVSLDQEVCSGDVAFARGHFHPNKPPGSSFVAVPGYFLLQKIERLLNRSPDDWRLLVVNAWLSSVLSVGVIAAFGCVLFFRLAKYFADGNRRIALFATCVFAFGTLYFPFATLLFDHDLTAVFLLSSFYWIVTAEKNAHSLQALYLSGFAAGMAAITNYVASAAVVLLTAYLFAKSRRSSLVVRHSVAFACGLLVPFLVICFYNQICYGSPFALSNSFQNPLFKDDGPTLLGMFGVPRPDYALALLISPFRGLFYSAPVLLLGVYGLLKMRKTHREEFWLVVAIFALFFLVNSSFIGWHAGFSCGPRYLIPALPFLALPVVFGIARFPRIAGVLALVSIAINFLFAVVDAESPAGVGSLAMVDERPMWSYSPFADYTWPLFASGRAWPILNGLIDESLKNDPSQTRGNLLATIQRADASPLLLATFVGPVSVNPVGVYEAGFFHLFGPHSKPARWASFNVGEFIFPQSRWSLAPLLIVEIALLALAFRSAEQS